MINRYPFKRGRQKQALDSSYQMQHFLCGYNMTVEPLHKPMKLLQISEILNHPTSIFIRTFRRQDQNPRFQMGKTKTEMIEPFSTVHPNCGKTAFAFVHFCYG